MKHFKIAMKSSVRPQCLNEKMLKLYKKFETTL